MKIIINNWKILLQLRELFQIYFLALPSQEHWKVGDKTLSNITEVKISHIQAKRIVLSPQNWTLDYLVWSHMHSSWAHPTFQGLPVARTGSKPRQRGNRGGLPLLMGKFSIGVWHLWEAGEQLAGVFLRNQSIRFLIQDNFLNVFFMSDAWDKEMNEQNPCLQGVMV